VWRRFTVDAPERLDSQIKERRHVGFLRDITTNNNCATAAALDLAPKLLSWLALRVVVDCDRAPSTASRDAIPYPMPELAPVTIAAAPARLPFSRICRLPLLARKSTRK
jgi:hypothetical protein